MSLFSFSMSSASSKCIAAVVRCVRKPLFAALNGLWGIRQESCYCHGTVNSPFWTVCGFINFFASLWIVLQVIFCSVLKRESR